MTRRERTSDALGLVQFPHFRGAEYQVKVGDGGWSQYEASLAGDSFSIDGAISR